MFTKCILARGGHAHWGKAQKIVRTRIKRWLSGDIHGLWSAVDEQGRWCSWKITKKKSSPESLRVTNARRARCAIEDGHYRRATQALTSRGLAQASPEILA